MARKNATAEAIDMLRTEVRTNIELLRGEVHTNIELLREEVHTNAARSNVLMEDMRSQFKVVVENIEAMHIEVRQLRADFDR